MGLSPASPTDLTERRNAAMLSSAIHNSQPDLFTQLTHETWEAIRVVRRRWPEEIDWSKVRRAIEEAGREFSEIENQREQRRRSVEYKEALERAQGNLRGLQATLSQLEMLSPSGDDLDGLPDLGFELLEERLNHLRSQYATWSTPFGGRKNRNRETLKNRLLSIWEEQLHGQIRSSKNKVDEPAGPLLRFLTLTLTAITGDAPRPSGIKSIIDQAKKRRRSGKSKKRMPTRPPSKQQGQKN
jgi:hypothetical protein